MSQRMLQNDTVAIPPNQRQRMWLDLTEYKVQDWMYPTFNQRPMLRQPNLSAELMSTGLKPSPRSPIANRPSCRNLSTANPSDKSLPNMPERSAAAARDGPGERTFEKSLPIVPERSSSTARGGRSPKTYRHFPLPPNKNATAANLSSPDARKSRSTTALKEKKRSTNNGNVKDDCSITYLDREDSLTCKSPKRISPQSDRYCQRNDHATAVKKRDLTSDISAQKISSLHSRSVSAQCRGILHESLNLSSINASRSPMGTNDRLQHKHQSSGAENGKQDSLRRRIASRQIPKAPLEETIYTSKKHNSTSPAPHATMLQTPSGLSDEDYCQCENVVTTTDDASSTAAMSRASDTRPHSPSIKVLSSGEPAVLDADRIIIEVLRRMAGRMGAYKKDDRMPIMKVTESLTREVLCICKELTDTKPIKII